MGLGKKVFLVSVICFLLTACSVGMALHGQQDANLGAISIGQDRSIVMLNLGQPTRTFANEDGRVDTYNLEKGNAPSVGRAAGHLAMDVFTLGLWEILGTPIEGFAGEEYTLTVEYGPDDKLKNIVTTPGHSAMGSLK